MKTKLLGVSLITVTCLYGLLAVIAIPIVMAFGGEVSIALLACICVVILQFLISPWLTDISMRWFYKADFHAQLPDYLMNFINEECQKYNIKNPKIAIIDDGAPNAFTYGRTKKSARIVITRGILEMLSEQEAVAVVGHEIGHIVHLDMLVMTVVQIVPLVLYAVYEMCMKADEKSSSDDKNNLAIVGIIAYILYVISQYIVLWISRVREYYADRFSAEETKNPNALSEALIKIGLGLSTRVTTKSISKKNALGIADSKASKAMAITSFDENGEVSKDNIKNAMKWEMWNPWAVWYEIHSTHPLTSKRINRLADLAKEYGQEPYVVFDLEKTESFTGTFIKELIIDLLPVVSLLGMGTFLGFFIYNQEEGTPMFSNVEFINWASIAGVAIILFTIFSFIKFRKRHGSNYKEAKVSELLSEVKVSDVTAIPCVLEGEIIGRGNPGCIFNEDYIIKDETGIIFLDYNQPLNIMNKIFAIFRSEQNIGKKVTVKGWYRRSPVPYVEMYEYEIDGNKKTIHTSSISKVLYAILAIGGVVITIAGAMGYLV